MKVWQVLLIILVILIAVLVVLYFLGKSSRWTRKTGNGEKHAVGYVQNLRHMQLR